MKFFYHSTCFTYSMWCALHEPYPCVYIYEMCLPLNRSWTFKLFRTPDIDSAELIRCEKSIPLCNWFLEASMPCEGIEDFRIVIILCCAWEKETALINTLPCKQYGQWWAKWWLSTNMWHPETPASYESLPAPLATQIPTLWVHTSGGRGRGGALILDRCRAFDLFASVDAHLWIWQLSAGDAKSILL